MAAPVAADSDLGEREERILDAVVSLIGAGGVAAVSMRAVAREADVALGLMNYYFDTKSSLIAAALRRIGAEDALLVTAEPGLGPTEQLGVALRRVVGEEFLRPEYLGLRLQLWSLATVDPEFAEINRNAQLRYRQGLADLIGNARPDLAAAEIARRAADILVIQNGIWLTSILIVDPDAIARGIEQCEKIALSD